MSCEEDVGYENPPAVKCPCKGCDGELKMDGFNGSRTLVFLLCDECAHCCHASLSKTESRIRDMKNQEVQPPFRRHCSCSCACTGVNIESECQHAVG